MEEGMKISNASMVVYVHPSKSTKIYDAIVSELSSLLFTYNERFDGVVLAYAIDDYDKTAKVLNGLHPYLGVKLRAKLFLFSPRPNMLLEGKVVKVTEESIHLIVLGFASAVIEHEDIRKEFEYKIKRDEEVFSSKFHKRHVVKVGSLVRFLVKSFDEEIIHITGSLVPDQTGSIEWLAKHSEDGTVTDRSETKRPSEQDSSLLDNNYTTSGEPSMVSEHSVKKSKNSKRHREES